MKFSNYRKFLKPLALAALVAAFIFLRLYKIDSSLLFFNDIGRDFLVLFNWQETGKPPLLGPQTSALPYNQSAVYFYLLYPLFILTEHSAFATILTGVAFYLAALGAGLVYLKNHPNLQKSYSLAFFLLTIHPQVIAQNRFIWNPSFTVPLVLLSFYAFYLLQKQFDRKNLAIFAGCLSLAVSLSYSIAPLLIAFMLLAVILLWRKFQFFWVWLVTGLAGLLWNLPTVVFELRHHFLLTNLLIHGEKLEQTAISLQQKFIDTLHFAFYNLSLKQSLTLLVLILTLAGLQLFCQKPLVVNRISNWRQLLAQPLTQALALFLLTLSITLIVPVSMQAHYVFAILTLIFLIISLLSKFSFALVFGLLSLFYLNPTQLKSYFAPAYRSVAQTEACANLLCTSQSEPLFVSVQAGLHPYHNGMEFKYLFKNAGCQIKELDTQISEAQRMAVVVDHSEYQHGQTKYNELTQFGLSQEVSRLQCEENLEIVILERLPDQPD